jgi:carbon starvation protein
VLFGTSNQLLAALSLLGISVWLRRSGRRSAFVWIPMAFVMVVTLTSLALQVLAAARIVAASGARVTTPTMNGAVSLVLLVLALVLIAEAVRSIRSGAEPRPSAA